MHYFAIEKERQFPVLQIGLRGHLHQSLIANTKLLRVKRKLGTFND